MCIPSFICVDQNQTIPAQTFDDLQLHRLFSEKTISILSHPGNAEEIMNRQELFRLMRTETGFERIKACYAQLKEYERTTRMWHSSAIPVEKRFLFYDLLQSYRNVCSMLSDLNRIGASAKLKAISAFWQTEAASHSDLAQDLETMQTLLKQIGRCNLSSADQMWLTKDEVPHTISEELRDAAEALGLPFPNSKTMRIRINDAISHAIEELYPKENAQFDVLSEKYSSLSFDAPVSYLAELDFFFAILALCREADAMQIPVCYPKIAQKRQYLAKQAYDISLFVKKVEHIVPNDTFFTEDTPFFFITGANGGGKTTYLRTCGINLILFLAGCPIFAEEAEVYPFHSVRSHFPADERFAEYGRLEEEKQRVDALLAVCDADTFLVFNETYSGTDDTLGCEMTLETASHIKENGAFGLFVTHFHEVRRGGVPMLNTVIEEDEMHKRTFRIVRDFGISSSYANDILRKYKLDAASLKEREQRR